MQNIWNSKIINFLSLVIAALIFCLYRLPAERLKNSLNYNADLYIDHLEGLSLTTQGKWFFYEPHRFLTDAFSGEVGIFYNYLSDSFQNYFAYILDLPPMVVQAEILGPALGAILFLLNYFSANILLKNRLAALLGALCISLWSSGFVALEFTPNIKYTTLGYLHLPFGSLALGVAQSYGWLLFLPFLVGAHQSLGKGKYVRMFLLGAVLAIELQIHILTTINLIFIYITYISALQLSNKYNRFEDSWPLFRKVILLALTALVLLGFMNFRISLLVLLLIIFIPTVIFIWPGRGKYEHIILAVGFACCSMPLLIPIVQNWSMIEGSNSATSITFYSIPLGRLIQYYLPILIAAWFGIKALVKDKKHTELQLLVAALFTLFVFSYNERFGWGNHPYRYSINLIFPLGLLAGYGVSRFKLFSPKEKIALSLVMVATLGGITKGIAEYSDAGSQWVNYKALTEEEGRIVSSVKDQFEEGNRIFTSLEFDYPAGVTDTSLILNYSKAPSYNADYRYLLSKSLHKNRAQVFCFFFPTFPAFEIHTNQRACDLQDGKTLDAQGKVRLLDARLKNNSLDLYKIQGAATLHPIFDQLLTNATIDYQWKNIQKTTQGSVVDFQESPRIGGRFEPIVYSTKAAHIHFAVDGNEEYLVVLARVGQSAMSQIILDGSVVVPIQQDNKILVLKSNLSEGKHSLVLDMKKEERDNIYFIAAIPARDAKKLISGLP